MVAAGAVVYLRGLSHPLLLADYLAQRQKLELQARLNKNAVGGGSGGRRAGTRLLPTSREAMAK